MITERQWNLYILLPWPNYIPGRDLAKLYEKNNNKKIEYGSLYIDMRSLVESGFAESQQRKDEYGTIREFRKKSGGKRPEKPKRIEKNLEEIIIPEPA